MNQELGNTSLTISNFLEPSVEFFDLLGGSNFEEGTRITTDYLGNLYITGSTTSPDFEVTPNAVQNSFGGGDEFGNGDAFIAKYSPEGTLTYATYIGGSGKDFGTDIAVDPITGDIYVTGNTNSVDFPTVNALQKTYGGGDFFGDAFIVKLSNDGSNILYSTYLGGQDNDDGSDLIFSTYYGGVDGDLGNGIAINDVGDIYVAGNSGIQIIGGDVVVPPVGEFPTVNALYSTFGGGDSDGILIRINSERLVTFGGDVGGSENDEILLREIDDRFVEYATYLGTENYDSIESIDLDAAGNIYIVSNNNLLNTVVSKISNDGQVIEYSLPFRINENLEVFGNDIEVDEVGNAYFVGRTIPTFALESSMVSDLDTIEDAFVAKFADNTYSSGEGFNENLYLIENPGVGNAVANGFFGSGFEHWLEFGFWEGRSPQFAFDEQFYLATYSHSDLD